MRRRLMTAGAVVLSVMLGISGCSGLDTADGDTVAVQSVSMLAGLGNVGVLDRYPGVVVGQATQEIEKEEDQTVKELKVAVGDTVKEGDVLFVYDTDEIQLSIDTGKLEIEKLENEIESTKKQIAQLEKEKKKASSSDQLSYSIEIQSLEADNKENEYNLKTKKVEQERLEKSVEDTEVRSEIDGVVQSINEDGSSTDDYGNTLPYITLMETGTYRVKGTINEVSWASGLGNYTGESVIVRSRVDSEQTWEGTLGDIDTENPESSSSDIYYSDSDEMTSSTKYPFYITFENSDGMMMGQHVYIELDQGQDEEKDGIWLASTYLVIEENGVSYVWAATDKDKLEKRSIVVGEYNEELDEYEITSGLEAEDYIAIPDESLKEGQAVTRYDETYFSDTDDDEDLGDEDGDEDLGDEDLGDEDLGDEDLGDEELGDEDLGDDSGDPGDIETYADGDLGQDIEVQEEMDETVGG